MKTRLNPWFVVGIVFWVLWVTWLTWLTWGGLFSDPISEYEAEPLVLLIVVFAFLPIIFLIRIPRQIEDDGRRWWQPDVLREIIVTWTINVVQVIVAMFVLVYGMYVAFFYLDPAGYDELGGPYWLREFLGRCDTLDAQLATDYQCLNSDDCMMTRDELESFNERVAKHELHCKVDNVP